MRTRVALSGIRLATDATAMSGKLRLTAPLMWSWSYLRWLRASSTIVPGPALRRANSASDSRRDSRGWAAALATLKYPAMSMRGFGPGCRGAAPRLAAARHATNAKGPAQNDNERAMSHLPGRRTALPGET